MIELKMGKKKFESAKTNFSETMSWLLNYGCTEIEPKKKTNTGSVAVPHKWEEMSASNADRRRKRENHAHEHLKLCGKSVLFCAFHPFDPFLFVLLFFFLFFISFVGLKQQQKKHSTFGIQTAYRERRCIRF